MQYSVTKCAWQISRPSVALLSDSASHWCLLQGDRSLMVQWMDVNQLSQEENLHSKCLCVDRLPLDLCDSEELTQLFSDTYKPVFCQVRSQCTENYSFLLFQCKSADHGLI